MNRKLRVNPSATKFNKHARSSPFLRIRMLVKMVLVERLFRLQPHPISDFADAVADKSNHANHYSVDNNFVGFADMRMSANNFTELHMFPINTICKSASGGVKKIHDSSDFQKEYEIDNGCIIGYQLVYQKGKLKTIPIICIIYLFIKMTDN